MKNNKQASTTLEQPNIKFIGGRIGREPIRAFVDGNVIVALPLDSEQSKPFYHAEAARIARLFPLLYKPVTDK